MTPPDSFDPGAFKTTQRSDWQVAAPGWRRWHDMLEAGGAIVSRTLVELANVRAGDTVLDIATGYGEPALTAARAVGSTGRVMATDIAPDMLEFGRERAAHAGLDNIDFLEADAETLSFEKGTFDAILCRQGLQFLPDVEGTLARLHTILEHEGRLAAAVWGPQDSVQFARPVSVIAEALALPAPPPGRPGIFALADRDRLSHLVIEAGFRDVETGSVTVTYETQSPQEFTQWIRDVAPPIAKLLNGQPCEIQEQIWRNVTEASAHFATSDGRVRTENEAVWVAATN
jgi:SAM-dependent methyltransferase